MPQIRLQIFLVRDQYLRSLLSHGDQTIAIQIEKHILKPMLAILTTGTTSYQNPQASSNIKLALSLNTSIYNASNPEMSSDPKLALSFYALI